MSKNTLTLDSTQLEAFGSCPQLWNLNHLQQLEKIPMTEDDNRALNMGKYGHSLLETYYKARTRGEKQAVALEAALSISSEELLDAVDVSAVKKQVTLYTYTYSSNDIIAASPESVEVGFSEKIYEDSDWIYVLEGRIDLLGTLSGQDTFMDHKFQLRSKNLYKKSIQFKNYAMVAKKTIGIINYIRITKEVTKDTFKRDIISFTPTYLDWWRSELIKLFDDVRATLVTGVFEHRWSSCSGKFGYACQMSDMCDERSLAIRKNIKQAYYQIKKEWKPW